jgi:hypothetical protein
MDPRYSFARSTLAVGATPIIKCNGAVMADFLTEQGT